MKRTNLQVQTRWADARHTRLVTELVDRELPALRDGEILVEMLYVPMHGSFWMAVHPQAIHPRKTEFLQSGSFVFGNGGVGRVVATSSHTSTARVGDFVCIFGHVPCGHYDCYACTVLHRYTECDFGESTILGHGKGGTDGSYARYCVLPPLSYEICYRAEEKPTAERLLPFMYGFLLADVRNALTRHPDTLRNRRMLLFGAGLSGHCAAYLHLHTCPEARIVVVDPVSARLESIRSLQPEAVGVFPLTARVSELIEKRRDRVTTSEEVKETIEVLADRMRTHFHGRLCNILFDASTGNTAQLWDNSRILSPTTHCIVFGFGSEFIMLDKHLIQTSGLNLLMTRGVGNLRNRREVVELIKAGAAHFIERFLMTDTRRLGSLEEAMEFIREQHEPAKPLHLIPHAYMTPNPL